MGRDRTAHQILSGENDMPFAAWTETLFKDLRYAARQFARNPVFTAVAVASLAIGIGANTAIFSVLDAAMLKSLPVRDPHKLVMLTDPDSAGVSSGLDTGQRRLLSYAEFALLRDHLTPLDGLCVAQSQMSRLQVRFAGGQP